MPRGVPLLTDRQWLKIEPLLPKLRPGSSSASSALPRQTENGRPLPFPDPCSLIPALTAHSASLGPSCLANASALHPASQ